MRRIQFILLAFLVIIASLKGQEVRVTASFDSSRIFLGDQVHYTVTVDKPVSFILSVPVLKDTLTGKIEILSGPKADTSLLKDGRVRIRQQYLVTSFDSGLYQVPPVYAELRTSEGIKRFYSDFAQLEVMRVKLTPPDTATGIFDIISPYKAPLTLAEVIPWLLALVILAASVWYGIRLYMKLRSKGEHSTQEVVSEPAHIIAFKALEKLREEKLWQNGEIKAYHTKLSEILREYLENRFSISSLELTTAESLNLLKRSGFRDDESFNKLKSVLTSADLVKFAKYKPGPPENELHFEHAWDFVSLTRYEEPAVEQPKAADKEQKS